MAADQSKAVQWYSVAAKAGNRKAMHNLAVAYAQGSGVQKDMASAAQWFGRAAALGLADSQFNLAVLYERGMGVPQSLSEAYKWYAIAAAQGDVESKTRLEALDSQMNADDKASAQKAASDFHANPPNRGANAPPDSATVLGG
jgi:localization factor PodJL